ncbi:hypothetical protein BJX70DRAFT_395796 [Aspergillus crustosus]
MERILHRRPSYGEGSVQPDLGLHPNLERRSSHDENENGLENYESPFQAQARMQEMAGQREGQHHPVRHQRHQRRDSALQKFREFMKNQEELDEASKMYAKLM